MPGPFSNIINDFKLMLNIMIVFNSQKSNSSKNIQEKKNVITESDHKQT